MWEVPAQKREAVKLLFLEWSRVVRHCLSLKVSGDGNNNQWRISTRSWEKNTSSLPTKDVSEGQVRYFPITQTPSFGLSTTSTVAPAVVETLVPSTNVIRSIDLAIL